MLSLYPVMRSIPAGTLHMGFSTTPLPADLSPAAAIFPHGDADERPYHEVSVSRFALAQTEVTNKQFERFDASHKQYRGRLNMSRGDDDAVLWVSWEDAVSYCRWLTDTVGAKQTPPMVYRLPTEAEWEHAARGNSSTRESLFWVGDTVPPTMRNHNDRNGGLPKPDSPPTPTRVGRFAPNGFGLYDTLGNVEEWVHDFYGAYDDTAQHDPCGPPYGSLRVTRGGSHSTELYYLRTANRAAAVSGDRSWFIGFRVAASVGEEPRCSFSFERPSSVATPSSTSNHATRHIGSTASTSTTPMPPRRRAYVHIPPSGASRLPFAKHNHDPTIVACPAAQGGGLLASWFSTACGEPGRCTGLVSARLEDDHEAWTTAEVDLDVADRCQCCPSFLLDRTRGVLYQFSAMTPAGDWSGFYSGLMGIVRWSTDCGRTWNADGPRVIWPAHGVSHQVVVTALRSERTGEVLIPTDHWGPTADPYDYCFTTKCDQTVIQHAPSTSDVPNPSKWRLAPPGANQSIFGFGYNHTGSHHSALVELRNGSYLAIGRGHPVDGAMPMSISIDGAYHWSTARASPFPAIHGGQRAILIRIGSMSEPLLLCSFANPPGGLSISCSGTGCPFVTVGVFCALSLDEGNTWPFQRPITTNMTAAGERVAGTDGELFSMAFNSSEPDGYMAATVDETGAIHLITSRNHYEFNRAWLQAPVPPPPNNAAAAGRLRTTDNSTPVPTDPDIYAERRRRHWCGPLHESHPLPGLDDADCVKHFPPVFDYDFTCPSAWHPSSLSGFATPTARADALPVHQELQSVVPPGTTLDAKVAVGIIRRETTGGAPLVRYLGNGAERVAHQPWSSSKVFAVAAAAARLRALRANLGLDASEETAEQTQAASVGVPSTPLADLMTIIASYDVNSSRPGVTSNALGAYFHAIGGHAAANDYLHHVIGAEAGESFGGNYGEPVPASAGFTLVPGSPPRQPVEIPTDPTPQPPISNHMSCLTMAEWLRRIVCVREEEPRHSGQAAITLAPLTWRDSSAILYGAPESSLFPGLQWGGLSMGTDVYVQRGLNLSTIDERSDGRWRIFSKLGAGISSTAHPGQFEITLNAYACLPDVKRGEGLEVVLSAAVAAKTDKEADAGMLELVANVTTFLRAHYDYAR